jgi:hypothetical protein
MIRTGGTCPNLGSDVTAIEIADSGCPTIALPKRDKVLSTLRLQGKALPA